MSKIYTGYAYQTIAPGASLPIHWDVKSNQRRTLLREFTWTVIIRIGTNQVVPIEANEDLYMRLYVNGQSNIEMLNTYMLDDSGPWLPPINGVTRGLYYLKPGRYNCGVIFDYSIRISAAINNLSPITTYTYEHSIICAVEEENL